VQQSVKLNKSKLTYFHPISYILQNAHIFGMFMRKKYVTF